MQSLTDVGRQWASRVHWQPESLPPDPETSPPPMDVEPPKITAEIVLPELAEISSMFSPLDISGSLDRASSCQPVGSP